MSITPQLMMRAKQLILEVTLKVLPAYILEYQLYVKHWKQQGMILIWQKKLQQKISADLFSRHCAYQCDRYNIHKVTKLPSLFFDQLHQWIQSTLLLVSFEVAAATNILSLISKKKLNLHNHNDGNEVFKLWR